MIIDRTDINVEQREPWLKLAKEKAGKRQKTDLLNLLAVTCFFILL